MEATIAMPANIARTLLAGFTMGEAYALLLGGTVRRGHAVHPGDPVGKVLAWLWAHDRYQATLFLADLLAELREHQAQAPDPKVRLDDLLAGLGHAMPHDFPGGELALIIAAARADVPGYYGADPNA